MVNNVKTIQDYEVIYEENISALKNDEADNHY